MTKTTFSNGTVVTAAFLNAINNPVFVEVPDNDGEIARLTDADLTSAPGNLKPEWQAWRDSLRISAGAGLVVNYGSGVVQLPNGQQQSISAGTITCDDNAINFIHVNTAGAIAKSTTIPARGVLLASVTTSSGAIAAITDLRPRFIVQALQRAVKVLGGGGDEGAKTVVGSETLDRGEYYFSSLTVPAGTTLNIPAFARILVAGNVQIDGTITVSQAVSGGSTFATNVVGTIGGLSGAGPGGGSGSGSAGNAYNFALAPHGSGGGTGFVNLTSGGAAALSGGGRGGGGLIIEAGGTITVTGTITALGGNASAGSLTSGTGDVSGGGGGSGGLILLRSLSSITFSAAASLSVRGGNGAAAAAGSARGGGAGGGGQVVLMAPTTSTGGATITLSAGSDGADIGGAAIGGGAGGGFGGGGGVRTNTITPAAVGQLITRNFAPVG